VHAAVSRLALLCTFVLAPLASALAETYVVGPEDYRSVLRDLRPGDRLVLEPGVYRDGLPVHRLHGTPDAPIVIEGPAEGEPARFVARERHNTVSLLDAAHVIIRRLLLDGQGLAVDAVKAEGHARYAHDITLEGLTIVGHGASQQIVGISTKCPTWNWRIRGNLILGAGTGLYLGDSDGSAPFVNGLIEHNVIAATRGYNLQIKHQRERPDLEGMPRQPSTTVIRHNAFSKARNAADGRMARPNVLLGHFPPAGPGRDDQYQVYANLFYQNPSERLLQGEGNIALHNNLFVNTWGDAVVIQPHHDVPRHIRILHNTVLARGVGIAVRGGDPTHEQLIAGNAVFAERPLHGGRQRSNASGAYEDAARHLHAPFEPPAALDLSPRPGALQGRRLALDGVDQDVLGAPRDSGTRGAFARPGPAPHGWEPWRHALRWLE
jgi:hypothetical protein